MQKGGAVNRKLKVYIAGPYTKGDVGQNVRNAMLAWDELATLGYAPFCPHWSHYQHLFMPRPYEDWLTLDLEWLTCCDAVLRLPGESAGADREVALAKSLDIPVYESVDDIAVFARRA